MNHDESLDRLMAETLARSTLPPEPPVDEMWAVIEQRAFRTPDIIPVHSGRSYVWRMPALAAAAALLVGTALGWSIAPRTIVTRVVAANATGVATPQQAATNDRAPFVADVSSSDDHGDAVDASRSRMSARAVGATTLASMPRSTPDVTDMGGSSDMVRYLAQTSRLLASLPSGQSLAGSDTAIAHRASDLLTQTHLLLDSRAGSDPTLHRLLEDLELVLAQVARLRSSGNGADLQLIHQALTVHDVLPRVYDATLEASTTD